MNVGAQIKQARKSKGMTAQVLANRTGIAISTVFAVESDRPHRGSKGPRSNDMDTLLKIVGELQFALEFDYKGRRLVLADVSSMQKLVSAVTRPVKR